jgi:hypothetical protein
MTTFRIVLTLTANAQLCLGPLILIGLLALTRARPQLTILLTAIVSLPLLLLGVLIYDISTQLRDAFFVVEATVDQGPLNAIAVSLAFLGIGGALGFAATVLALSRAAQTKRWGWFAGLAIFLVIGAAASVAAYDRYSLVLWDARFDGQPFFFTPATRSPIYFVLWSVIVVIAPLMALLYGAIVRDGPTAQRAGPLEPGSYAPSYPAANYPPGAYPPVVPSPPPGYPPASYLPAPPAQQPPAQQPPAQQPPGRQAPGQSYPPSGTNT